MPDLPMTQMKGLRIEKELDLRGVLCPYNYVKTKLALEGMGVGQILSVLIDEGEPELNVPRSVVEEGQQVLRAEKVDGHCRLFIQKRV